MALEFENSTTQKPQPTNYFISTERRYQTNNFVVYLKPEQIQRSAKERLFKEMLRGQIDYSIYGRYFLDPKFLENVLIAAQDELNNNAVILESLRFYDLNYPGISDVVKLIGRHTSLVQIFSVLCGKLESIRVTGDIGVLVDTAYILKPYRNIL